MITDHDHDGTPRRFRLYISGPMTGIPEHNFPAFHAAAERLAALGYDVVDPARHELDPSKAWEDYLRRDLADLVTCDALALLPDWQASRGATLEVHVARTLSMPCQPLADFFREPTDEASR